MLVLALASHFKISFKSKLFCVMGKALSIEQSSIQTGLVTKDYFIFDFLFASLGNKVLS